VDKGRRLRLFGKLGYLLWVDPHCERDFLNFLLQSVFTVCLMGMRCCIRFNKFYDHHISTIVVVRKQIPLDKLMADVHCVSYGTINGQLLDERSPKRSVLGSSTAVMGRLRIQDTCTFL
jgi:hypothetical protein